MVAFIALAIVIPVTVAAVQKRHLNDVERLIKQQGSVIEQQNDVIDSLIARRPAVIDCKLYVTDRSRSTARHIRGSVYMPNERKYVIEIDSTSIKLRE